MIVLTLQFKLNYIKSFSNVTLLLNTQGYLSIIELLSKTTTFSHPVKFTVLHARTHFEQETIGRKPSRINFTLVHDSKLSSGTVD